jgi:YD repeat-containing protein
MTAIFTGLGAGFVRSSATALGNSGLLGSAAIGRNSDNVAVNAATGNLVITRQDEFLVGLGPDVAISRTYNSLAQVFDRDNGDQWQMGTVRRVFGAIGDLSVNGSTVKRLSGDGSVVTYTYGSRGGVAAYWATDGDGTHDKLEISGVDWVWTDGGSQLKEVYEASVGSSSEYRIKEARDIDGNTLVYTYVSGTNRLSRVTTGLSTVTTADDSWVEYYWSEQYPTQLDRIETGYTDFASSTVRTLTRVRYGYDASNRLASVTIDLSPEDNAVTDGKTYVTNYSYDGATKRIAGVSQSDGSSLAIYYDASGRVSTLIQTVTGSETRQTSFAYGSGYAEVTAPDGSITRLGYNGSNELTSIHRNWGTAAQHKAAGFLYDPDGNVTRVTDGAGAATNYTYDELGNQRTGTDPNGNTVTRYYESGTGRILREATYGDGDTWSSDPAAHNVIQWTRYAYDGAGRLRFRVGPVGDVTEYRYHANGALSWVIDYPEHGFEIGAAELTLGAMVAWREDLADRSSTRMLLHSYDARGNLIQTTSYGSATATGVASTAEGESKAFHVYDQAGRLLSRNSAGETAETFVYDGMGRLVASTDGAGGSISVVFDDTNSKTIVTVSGTPGNSVTTKTYNKAGELVAVTSAGSYDAAASESFAYDAMGRLRHSVDRAGLNSYFVYDAAGRLVGEINHHGHLVEHFYDAADRRVGTVRYATTLGASLLTTLADPANTLTIAQVRPASHALDIWNWTVYDDAGRVVQAINGAGGVTAFEYDKSDRVVKTIAYYKTVSVESYKTSPPASPVTVDADPARDSVTRNFYDRAGRQVATLDGEGYFTTFGHDNAGRTVLETAYAKQAASSLRAAGTFTQLKNNVSAGSSANREIRYVYDGQGQLRYRVDGLNQVTSFTYNSAGKLTTAVVHAAAISPSDYSYGAVKAAVAGIANGTTDRKSHSVYNAAGQLAYAIDAAGGVTRNTYNAIGELAKVTHYAETRNTPSLPGLATMDNWAAARESNADNRVARYYYTAGGLLRFSVDGEGYVRRYDYDGAGQNTRIVTWNGAVEVSDSSTIGAVGGLSGATTRVDYAYDAYGRSSVHDGENNGTVWSRRANGFTYFEFRGHETADEAKILFGNDAAGRLSVRWDGYGEGEQANIQYTYDGIGNLLTVKDGESKTTTYEYDRRGLVTRVTDAADGITTYEYNAFGEVVKVTDPRGHSSYRYYDNLGRVTMVHDAEKYVTETSYTAFGEVQSVTRRYQRVSGTSTTVPPVVDPHAKDATTSFEYDRRGLATKSTDAEGFFESYTYNAFGERASVTAKSKTNSKVAGSTTTFAYDKRGLLVSETLPVASYKIDGTVQSSTVTNAYAYDSRGNLVTRTEAAGLTEERVTTYVYDKANRLVETRGEARQVMDQANHLTVTNNFIPKQKLFYDARGNVVRSEDPAGNRTVFFYDDLDRKTAEIDALGTYTKYAYDKNGNVTSIRVYADAVTVVPATGGSEESQPAAPGTAFRETLFEYDNLNRMTKSSVTTANSSYSLTSGQWNPGSGSGAGAWVGSVATLDTIYTYDANGNVVKATNSRGHDTYSYYDRLGRKTAQVDPVGHVTTWTYNSEGNVLTERRYAKRFVDTPELAAAPSVAEHDDDRITQYTYDTVGNRLSEKRLGVKVHDGSGGTLPLPVTATIRYTYNGLGQVRTKEEAAGDTIIYAYDGGGRLLTEKKASFTDHNGNTVTPMVDYRYDGLGALVRTVAAGATGSADPPSRVTRYVYGAGGLLSAAIDAEGNQRDYFYDTRGLVVREQWLRAGSAGGAGTTEAILTTYDALGRVVEQTVAALAGGAWNKGDIASSEYNAFGELVRAGVNGANVPHFARAFADRAKLVDGVSAGAFPI